MCNCINIPIGSYEAQTNTKAPNGKLVSIDNCILNEIQDLWRFGVNTIESCCGHNQVDGYIAVAPESIKTMEALEYIAHNIDREDIFYPKTNFPVNINLKCA